MDCSALRAVAWSHVTHPYSQARQRPSRDAEASCRGSGYPDCLADCWRTQDCADLPSLLGAPTNLDTGKNEVLALGFPLREAYRSAPNSVERLTGLLIRGSLGFWLRLLHLPLQLLHSLACQG